MNRTVIYPNVDFQILTIADKYQLTVFTDLRKKHKGKYYLWRFYRVMTFGEKVFTPKDIIESINRFHAEIYRTSILGIVNPKLMRDFNGVIQPVFKRDPDQTDEFKRLIGI